MLNLDTFQTEYCCKGREEVLPSMERHQTVFAEQCYDVEVNAKLSGVLRTTSLKVEKSYLFENSVGSFLQNISHRRGSLECIAGTEAMFADLGHFAVSSIQVGTGSQSLYTAIPQLVFSSLILMTTAFKIALSQDFGSLLLTHCYMLHWFCSSPSRFWYTLACC